MGNELLSASLSVCCAALRGAAASDFTSSTVSSCVLFVQFITSWLQRALAEIRQAVQQRPEEPCNHVGIQIRFHFESNKKTLITLFAHSSILPLFSCPFFFTGELEPLRIPRTSCDKTVSEVLSKEEKTLKGVQTQE